MNIAICDDSFLDRELFIYLLESYFSDKTIAHNIDEYENGIQLLYEVEDGRAYDVIFLDIFMEKILGIEVAKRLRKLNYNGQIIFLTASSDFAVDSYEVNASGYLLKPLNYEKLSSVIDRTINNIQANTYHIRRRNSFIIVPYDEILYVESNNSKCILHRFGGTNYVIYKKLGQIEDELNDERFLRSHQSYLVNMDYIVQVNRQFELVTGESVLIRQRNLKEIRSIYLDYAQKHYRKNPISSTI